MVLTADRVLIIRDVIFSFSFSFKLFNSSLFCKLLLKSPFAFHSHLLLCLFPVPRRDVILSCLLTGSENCVSKSIESWDFWTG